MKTPSHKPRYTTFYLTLLIISSTLIGSTLLMNLASVPSLPAYFSFTAYMTMIGITEAILLINTVALVLLWFKKNPLGIILTIGSFAAAAVANFIELFTVPPVIQAMASNMATADPTVPHEIYELFMNIGVYSLYAIWILGLGILAVLWWFAYKKQRQADSH